MYVSYVNIIILFERYTENWVLKGAIKDDI